MRLLRAGHSQKGEGDAYSDIEFWLFFDDEKLNDVDQEQWIKDVAPIYWFVSNEHGTRVAFFKDHLIRGEFHFAPASVMDDVQNWPSVAPERASKMVIVEYQQAARVHSNRSAGGTFVSNSN
jgi:lincosamide nucleotidyltransferase B/F